MQTSDQAEEEQVGALAGQAELDRDRVAQGPAVEDVGRHRGGDHHGPTAEEEPEGHGVEAGERQAGGADLQGHDGRAEAEPDRQEEQEHRHDAVHGEQLAVGAVAHHRGVGRGQLGPHDEGQDDARHEEQQGGGHEQRPDVLVVGALGPGVGEVGDRVRGGGGPGPAPLLAPRCRSSPSSPDFIQTAPDPSSRAPAPAGLACLCGLSCTCSERRRTAGPRAADRRPGHRRRGPEPAGRRPGRRHPGRPHGPARGPHHGRRPPAGGRAAAAPRLPSVHPLVAWLLFAATGWLVHFTPLFETATESLPVHVFEHALLLGGGLLFWAQVVGPAATLSYPLRLLYLVVAMPQNTFVALAIFSTKRVLYPHYGAGADALADQRLAGGIMWVAGDLVLLAAVLVVAGAWARHEERQNQAQ